MANFFPLKQIVQQIQEMKALLPARNGILTLGQIRNREMIIPGALQTLLNYNRAVTAGKKFRLLPYGFSSHHATWTSWALIDDKVKLTFKFNRTTDISFTQADLIIYVISQAHPFQRNTTVSLGIHTSCAKKLVHHPSVSDFLESNKAAESPGMEPERPSPLETCGGTTVRGDCLRETWVTNAVTSMQTTSKHNSLIHCIVLEPFHAAAFVMVQSAGSNQPATGDQVDESWIGPWIFAGKQVWINKRAIQTAEFVLAELANSLRYIPPSDYSIEKELRETRNRAEESPNTSRKWLRA
ncbi:hypothetical protein WN51_14147 [Melipona quadrifasciata]|uniref:Uncharacterized protein n=1 Tax=Melipona quadrifasciata TaxID=166423 RepID=A0A0M8ZZG5_9HYME|nr:hypothetical protein WN51_14147 [Melipona quadrifasciata]